MKEESHPSPPEAIAVIGFSGRFPGAKDPDEFWRNLMAGRDCISRFGENIEHSIATGETAGQLHVAARGTLDDVDMFDASFFGIYPREAELMDPQHRVFLECAWEALEHAGQDPATCPGLIGVYAGLSLNTYLLWQLGAGKRLASNYQVGDYQTMLGNDKDFLPTRVSYKLNLRGPSMAVQSACSTSLVAICQAATALLAYQCDMALAGAVSISFPQRRDYLYQEDGMVSPDGTCRAFDEAASGTVFGHGCGVVLLKRLSEALADRDPILAVIKGWAVNNDGSEKIGFAAPGLNAQADVISQAQAAAGVDPSSISYVEAHGTGTPLGDPVEVAALTKAFRDGGATGNRFCAIGTGKTHVGHLDVAAGVTGVIKTILQLRHQRIPSLLHFRKSNPKIDFPNSPFFPVDQPREWPRGGQPRRAGVSAFGVGGTNAHVIIEEAPPTSPTSPPRSAHLLVLAARSEKAVDSVATRLAALLTTPEAPPLADTAYTLAVGRHAFPWRRVVVVDDNDLESATRKLRERGGASEAPAQTPPVAFLFPGQGSQHPDMGRELHETEPVFRAAVDECAAILQPLLETDIRATLYPVPEDRANAEHRIHETWLTQPCIFVVEYALAKLWISWGIKPSLLIGHSIGEYVAAVLAGTFSLPDALRLLATRARLMQELPGGSMMAVRLGADELASMLPQDVELAASNSVRLSTVSGPTPAIEAFRQRLDEAKIPVRFLPTSHAFHSAMLEPMMEAFTSEAAKIPAADPGIPWISTCTAREVDRKTLSDPAYWSRQLRQPVCFAEALGRAFATSPLVLLEVGPGQALAPFARQHPDRGKSAVICSLPSGTGDYRDLMAALGELWKHGVTPDWQAIYQGQQRARVHLPTYPFERQRFWVDAPANPAPDHADPVPAASPTFQTEPPSPATMTPQPANANDRANNLAARIRALVCELSGVGIDNDTITFTELGFDSLFLTQASQAIQSRFGVKVTFRQMLGDLSSVAAIAAYLDAQLPPDAPSSQPPQTVPQPTAEALPQSAPGGDSLEQLMAANLRMMQSLLESRRTANANPPAPSPVPAPSLIRWPGGKHQPRPGDGATKRFGPYKPLDKGLDGALTGRQQRALDDLMSRYVRKTAGSKAYAAEHRNHFADPRAVSGFKSLWKEMVYPIVAARSKGSKIWDIDGNEFIDITMGFGTYFFGHSPDWLMESLERQLHDGIEIGPQSALAGKLARAICDLTNMDRATFCNTGSEAVMAAMRLARTVTGRDKIAYFTGDYHGMFDEVLVRASWPEGSYRAQPVAPGIPRSSVENMLVLDYGDPASLEILKTHGHELAAVLVEPVQSRNPALQPGDFLRELRAITRHTGTALVFDEVVTGFRCHPGGAQAYFGVEADMATYGKVLGGGLPIGVLAGKRPFLDALDGGTWNYGDDSFPEVGVTFFAGTFVRHPLAMAAAWRVVEHLRGQGARLQIDMTERVDRLCRTLDDRFAAAGVPLRMPCFSAFSVIEHPADLPYASLLWYYLREKGIHVWEGRPCYFTTAHTDEDLDRVVDAFCLSVEEMQDGGFLPGASTGNTRGASGGFPRRDSAPVTEAQREVLHAVHMGDEANCAFNESNVISFEGILDAGALRTALCDIVTRHPALRSTFSEDGQTQWFHPPRTELAVEEHDFTHLTPDARELRWQEIRRAAAATPFDLIHGPLLRLQLARIGPQRHELLLTAHHLVCDGWSFGMIVAELGTAYNARKAGRLPMLKPAMSFAEFARTEAANEGCPGKVAAGNYWVGRFSDVAPVLELPTDRPRPPLKTYAGAMETRVLDAGTYARIKTASPQLGGTLFATLLGTFATLLHRLTGQDDVVIGVPAAAQARIGRDELVGHCLNFLPLRLRPCGDRAFREFVAEVRDLVLEAYDHQDHTFGTLLKKLTLPRDPSRVPLVSAMFNIDRTGIDHVRFDGLRVDVGSNAKRFVNFDLFFNLVQTDERLVIECEYNTDLHDATTIQRWLAAFERLIEGTVEAGDTPLDSLPLNGRADEELVLRQWNATTRDYPHDATVDRLVGAVATRIPQKTAVRCGVSTLTYGQLELQAGQLAARLQSADVKPGDLVGIHLERSPEMVVALLAVMKTGAAYVPLDPSFPAERLAFMVEDARMPVILTHSALEAQLPATRATRILIDEPCTGSPPLRPVPRGSGDLAYVIYTSGSTGRPKGVRITQRSVVNFLNSMRREPGLSPDDVLLSVTTLSFDIAGLEIFLPLSTGATVVIANRETTLDGNLLCREIERNGVTVMQATPVTWRLMLEAGWKGKAELKALVGGEAVPRDLVNRMLPACAEVWNVYGPTETTIWSTTTRLTAGQGPVSIGKPIDNTRVYVVNGSLQPQPVGIAGELLIGGDGVADGYHGRPDLTADRFIGDPFVPGAKVYRTGDLARWLPDGSLECLGRMDQQVKLRGFRIELGEIEALLERHPAVAQAVARVHARGNGDNRLTAYLRLEDPKTTHNGTKPWQEQWDMLYQTAIQESGDSRLDHLDSVISAWSGLPNAPEHVEEWIASTVARIRALAPQRVLEIGCGTGQLLFRLAPDAEAYWATDISQVAISALERRGVPQNTRLLQRPADDFSGLPEGNFDTVILNSVVQYFPDVDYLEQVLAGITKLLAPGARVFLGDIQGNSLLEAHHVAALRERLPASATVGELREALAQRLANETELSIDPAWFETLNSRLPGLVHPEILSRRGRLVNETTTYHYDVIMHFAGGSGPVMREGLEWRDWRRSGLNIEQLEALLAATNHEVALTGIPDARLSSSVAFLQVLRSAPAGVPLPAWLPAPSHAVTTEELHAVANLTGRQAHVRWQGDGRGGTLMAYFTAPRHSGIPRFPSTAPGGARSHLANKPRRDPSNATDPALIAKLRQHLANHLPDYMIPSSFMVLQEFPLTPNGKIDRNALPTPDTGNTDPAGKAPSAPRNETEQTLVAIWQQVLGTRTVGIHDDIFGLGGDSILIFQIATRAARAGLALTPAHVFRHRTIAALADSLTTSNGAVAPAPAIQRVNRDAYRRNA